MSGAAGWLLAAWFAPSAWIVLACATVALAALLRRRWATIEAWKKCAVLSLWVHAVLACLAATIHLSLGGGPGAGPDEGGPIRVAFVAPVIESAPEATPAISVAPREAEPPPPVAPQPEPDRGETAEDDPPVETPERDGPAAGALAAGGTQTLAAPELLSPAPEPLTSASERESPAPALAAPASPPKREPEETPPTTAPAEPAPAERALVDAVPPPADAAPTVEKPSAASAGADAAPRPRAAPAYAKRFAADRAALVAGGGGNPSTEQAVRGGLAWLAAAQSPDGRWDPQRYGAGQERFVLGQDRGGAGARADAGMSGLALLALLGAGHTHQTGAYATQVKRGLDYLRQLQAPDGNLAGRAELFARMYCHSMASFALSEAYAMTGDASLAPAVRRAAAYSLAVQHPTDGGWRYRPGDTGDTSQLGWQLMALKSAAAAGVDVAPATWTRVDRFLRGVTRGAHGGLAAYRPEGPPTRTMSAEALYCRQLLTDRADGGLNQPALAEALATIAAEPPQGDSINLYYWYYATLALHRAQGSSADAAGAWRRWNDALAATLVAAQDRDGSWPPTCLWAGYGGRVYATALATMNLEVYYRYAADDDAPPEAAEVAGRAGWTTTPAR